MSAERRLAAEKDEYGTENGNGNAECTQFSAANDSLRLLDKLALLRDEPTVHLKADELIAIVVASAGTARRVNDHTIPYSRSRSLFRIRPFPPAFFRRKLEASPSFHYRGMYSGSADPRQSRRTS
jgi:hypothetical protein